MVNTSKNFSFSEMASLIGLDEKKIHVYCHKGLIGLNDYKNRLGFSDIDYARLRIIKHADDLGYQHEEIKSLIGSADDLSYANDPLMFCNNFAIQRYKQIIKELDNCEPLEQVKKQCDLMLISTYIKELKKIEPERIAKIEVK
jgi:DNA-binding transcriptional MerR regulator